MKYGPWHIGGACPSCNNPVAGEATNDSLYTGSCADCCPSCGELRPKTEPWPQRRFRRVKDGLFSPWRWQKWQEPVASGVHVTFTMSQPPEEDPAHDRRAEDRVA